MKNKIKNKGFTLIEMLVVVLIIGILAAIALPQYKMAVEKSRAAEVLMNLAIIKREMEGYIMVRGIPTSGSVNFKDIATVELSGGEWNKRSQYQTEFFNYILFIDERGSYIEIYRRPSWEYDVYCTQYEQQGYNNDSPMGDGWYCSCVTELTDLGRRVCKKVFEPLGFKYIDNEL